MQQEKTDIKSMNLEELKSYMESIGEKAFRAKQLYQWMHQKQASSFDEMTNLSKSLQEKLKNECHFVSLKQEAVQISKLDGTRKYLFALDDGNVIESVLMRYKHGNSVCISSQVGCRMGCRFCASTLDGLVRGLTPSEMLDQIYRITRDTGERVSNVVVMGTGEPMDNFDNLLRFIELLTDENGLNISQRNVTVSTCGIVPKMRELADKKLQITLALSLHNVKTIAGKDGVLLGGSDTFQRAHIGELGIVDDDADGLCSVHGRAAADGHDAVSLCGLESGHAVLHICDGGVGLDLAVDGVGEACSVQQVGDLLGDAELEKVGVRADESLLVAAGGQLGNDILDSAVAMIRNSIQNDTISHW